MGVDAWLAGQLDPALPDPVGDAVRTKFPGAFPPAGQDAAAQGWPSSTTSAACTLALQATSSRQLFEVVVDVFTNLLYVQTPEKTGIAAPDYYLNVIRRYAFGRYADMLQAAMRHTAMLVYLDNHESTKASVNENLGRELLELHTVGVAAGYTEADVRNSSYILSGRGMNPADWGFRYTAADHWTGPVSVLGFSSVNDSAAGGLAVGDAYIAYLASHPATARTVARELATRFVADNPPDALVARMAEAYLANDTRIVPMLTVLFSSTEFWSSSGAKTRRPLEDHIAVVRQLGPDLGSDLPAGFEALSWVLSRQGHAPWDWSAPNGYPDVAAAWLSPSGVFARWNLHWDFAFGWTALKPDPARLAGFRPTSGQTNGQWIDSLADRVTGQPLPAAERSAALGYLGLTADAAAVGNDDSTRQALNFVWATPSFQNR